MRAGGAIVASAFLLVVAACGFTLDGYSNGSGAAPDGGGTGTPSGDSGTAPISEAGTVTLDGNAPDDANANLCAQPNLYCSTFDDDSLATLADDETQTPGTIVEAVNGSVHTSAPASSGDAQVYATVEPQVADPAIRNALDADIFVTTPAWGDLEGNASILALFIENGVHQGEELYIDNGSTTITTTYQNSQFFFDTVSENMPYDRWVHVRIELDLTPGQGSFALYFDGQKVANRTDIKFGSGMNPVVLARLGISEPNPPMPKLDVLTDNVIITVLP